MYIYGFGGNIVKNRIVKGIKGKYNDVQIYMCVHLGVCAFVYLFVSRIREDVEIK